MELAQDHIQCQTFRIAVMNLMSSAVTVLDVNWTKWALM
jgi:hypothetical protein